MRILLLALTLFGLALPALGENVNPKVFSFKTMHAPNGTSPVASSTSDTLNFTSTDNSVVITGNSGTKTLNFHSSGGGGGNPGGTNGQIQFNSSSTFGGDTATTDGSGNWNATSLTLSGVTASTLAAFNSSKLLVSQTAGNLTSSNNSIGVSGGSGAVVGSGAVLTCATASGSQAGCLSSSDWTAFNGKQAALTIGNLSDAGTDGIIVTNGGGSVIGTGTSLAQHVADTSHNGYLSSTDWNTFNGKQASGSYITALTGDVTASGPGSSAASISAATVTGKALTGFSAGAGTVTASDSILTAFNKIWGWITNLWIDEINGQIETVANKTYTLVDKARYARVVNKINVACTSGTVTLRLVINSTSITSCTGLSVSSTPADTTCTAANSMVAGDQLLMVTTSNSSCTDLVFTVQTTRD